MSSIKLSVAICTYNRPELLEHCLNAVYPLCGHEVELILVDNGSEPVLSLAERFKELRYLRQEQTGLSHARNTAMREAKGDFVLYLDDDALADPKMIEQALLACTKYEVFGGVYIPWYHYGKPKWYKDQYASNKMKYEEDTALSPGEYLSGGIFAVKRSLLLEHHGFNTDLGMKGMQTGYGEESDLQDRLRAGGHQLIYMPNLIIKHVVAPYKLSVQWFLHSNYQRGKDEAKYLASTPWISALKAAIIAALILVKDLIFNSFRLIFKKNYRLENWRIDSFRKLYKRMGYIYQLIYAGRQE